MSLTPSDAYSATHANKEASAFVLPPAHSRENTTKPVRDRRNSSSTGKVPGRSGERRQFGDSHSGLSNQGRELAAAIDAYKLQHHRRYITCDEMLVVLSQLGYQQETASEE